MLLSGGLDSAVAFACARRDGFRVHALAVDYGQRHRHELACARRLAGAMVAGSFRVVELGLRAVGGSALTDAIDVPKNPGGPAAGGAGGSGDGGIPITYVPARNLTFLAIAAGLAEVVGARVIYIGVNAVDYSGYPDCRRPFIDAFERCAALGTRAGDRGEAVRVETPLVSLSKAGIIRLGASLGVEFALTSSCYDPTPEGLSCGGCESCQIRRRGFEEAGVADPTRYAAGAGR